MPAPTRLLALLALLLVPSVTSLVHVPSPVRAQAVGERGQQGRTAAMWMGQAGEGLPRPVAEMRETILEATRSGRLEDLKPAMELNELKPVIGDGDKGDPLSALRNLSADGEGRDILAALGRILEATWVAVPLGADIENNRIYVWPRFAVAGIATLDANGKAELESIVPADQLERVRQSGSYSYWRIAIAADGTWHSFGR